MYKIASRNFNGGRGRDTRRDYRGPPNKKRIEWQRKLAAIRKARWIKEKEGNVG